MKQTRKLRKLISTADAAKILAVSAKTIKRRAAEGMFQSVRLSDNANAAIKVYEAEILAFRESRENGRG